MGRWTAAVITAVLAALLFHGTLSHTVVQSVAIERAAERTDLGVVDTADGDPAHDSEHPPASDTERLAISGAGQAQPGTDAAALSADGIVDARATTLHSRLARDHQARSVRIAPCSIALQIFRC
ncbi:hypothetical protein ACWGID_19440 [Kribbella sp. NPDC054772]